MVLQILGLIVLLLLPSRSELVLGKKERLKLNVHSLELDQATYKGRFALSFAFRVKRPHAFRVKRPHN